MVGLDLVRTRCGRRWIARLLATMVLLLVLGCSPKRSVEGVFTHPTFGKMTFQRRGEVVYECDGLSMPGSIDDAGTYSIFVLFAHVQGDESTKDSEDVRSRANRIALQLDGGSISKGTYLNSAGEGRVRVTVTGNEARTGGGVVFLRQR